MIEIHNYKKLISTICIFVYFCLVFLSIVNATNLTSPFLRVVFNIFSIVAIFINVVFLLIGHHLQRVLVPLIVLFLFLIFLLSGIKIASLSLILVYVIYYNSDLMNFKSFVKVNLWMPVILFLMIILLNMVGIIPSVSNTTLLGVTKGHTFGFSHPDSAGVMIIEIISSLFILANYLVLRHHRHKVKILGLTTLASIVLTIIFYPLTQCRELLYFEIIIVILIALYKYKNLLYIIMLPLIILVPVSSIYLDYKFDPIKEYILNNLLSGRLNMQHIILEEYPIHFIQHSKDIPDLNSLSMGKGNILIDNSYLSILELFGIISIVIAAFILLKILISLIRINEYIPYVLVISIILCSVVQSSLFSMNLDGPLLYCGILFSYKMHIKSN